MKSKRKYNRKKTLRRNNALKSRIARKKRKYSQRRNKSKRLTGGARFESEPSFKSALTDRSIAVSEEPTLLPSIQMTYPPVTEDEFKKKITSMHEKKTTKSGKEIDILEKGKLGFITGHGLTVVDDDEEVLYFVVPDNICIAFNGLGAGIDSITKTYRNSTGSRISYYIGGSLCVDYIVEFRAVTVGEHEDDPDLFFNQASGVWSNHKTGSRLIPLKVEKFDEFIRKNCMSNLKKIDERDKKIDLYFHEEKLVSPDFVKKYYHSDEFGILDDITRSSRNEYTVGWTYLSEILYKLSEKRREKPEIPDLFICQFCRGGSEGLTGMESLSECEPQNFYDTTLSELPPELLGYIPLDDLSLRRESSLSGSSVLNNFINVIQELLTYGSENNSSWYEQIKTFTDLLLKGDPIHKENICIILQLRHTLSIKDVP